MVTLRSRTSIEHSRLAIAWNGLSAPVRTGVVIGSSLLIVGVLLRARPSTAPSPALVEPPVQEFEPPVPVPEAPPPEPVAPIATALGAAATAVTDGWNAAWQAQMGLPNALPPPTGHDAAWRDGWDQGSTARRAYDQGQHAGYAAQGRVPLATGTARPQPPTNASMYYAAGWRSGASLAYTTAASYIGDTLFNENYTGLNEDRTALMEGLWRGYAKEALRLQAGPTLAHELPVRPDSFDASVTYTAVGMVPTASSRRSLLVNRGWTDGVLMALEVQAGRLSESDAAWALARGVGTYRQ